jgi:DNA-binding transcriptional ArsR family regulator
MLTDELIRAVLHPVRLAILTHCEENPSTVAELADALAVSPRSVRRHVRVLTDERLLRADDDRYRTAEGWSEIVRQLNALVPPLGAKIAERLWTTEPTQDEAATEPVGAEIVTRIRAAPTQEEAKEIVSALSLAELEALARWVDAGTVQDGS